MAFSFSIPSQPKKLFSLIILVAVLSLIFHINLGYYELFVDESGTTFANNNIDPLARLIGDVKVLGRSLNGHTDEFKRQTDSNFTRLFRRLQKLEERLFASRTHHVLVAKTNFTDGQTRHYTLSETDGVSRVSASVVTQGNWSVYLCTDRISCNQAKPNHFQKVSWIEELDKIIHRPDVLCQLARDSEKRKGHGRHICHTYSARFDRPDYTRLVVSANEDPILVHETEYIKVNDKAAIVWPMTSSMISYRTGHLLRLRLLLTSILPLRFYVHPAVSIHMFAAVKFDKLTLEEVMQTMSEVYGLGTASRWWTAIQAMLLRYILHFENEVQRLYYGKSCQLCFQSFDVDVICTSIQECYVVQILNVSKTSTEYIEDVLSLINHQGYQADDVQVALQHTRMCQESQFTECDVMTGDENFQIDDVLLTYLIDWRAEMKGQSVWTSVYPGVPISSITRSGVDTERSAGYTTVYDDLLMDMVNYYNAIDTGSVQEPQYITSDKDSPVDEYLGQSVNCTEEMTSAWRINNVVTSPRNHVQQTSENEFNITVDYHTIMIRVAAISSCCTCEVRLENKYNYPGARNVMLGLGDTVLRMYIMDPTYDLKPVTTATLTVTRLPRSHTDRRTHEQTKPTTETWCAIKQDCSMIFDPSEPCGLQELFPLKYLPTCDDGDVEGRWIVPCHSCSDDSSCTWSRAQWQPYSCRFESLSAHDQRQCLEDRKVLFIGDSTNRGIANYIIQEINGSLYDWDKTHGLRVYHNVNKNKTQVSFTYYPHFWLPTNHRPTFKKLLYQLIKSSLPLENSSKTVLVIGGVHWLAKQHIDLIIEALQRKGLSGVTKVVKGLGAGFHQPVEGVRYVAPSEQTSLLQREREILSYAKTHGFKTVATFNMTISRYKDFLEGNCACHFHKVIRPFPRDNHRRNQFTVQGEINTAYSQILLNQIC